MNSVSRLFRTTAARSRALMCAVRPFSSTAGTPPLYNEANSDESALGINSPGEIVGSRFAAAHKIPSRVSVFPPSVTAQTRSDEVDNFYEKFNGDPESLDVGVKRRTVDLEMIKKRFEGLPKRQQRFYINRLSKVKPQKPPSLEPFKKVYQMRVIDVNRTCKVTKSGGILSFTAFVVCGNGAGVVGYGKGKSAEVSAAVDKAYSRSLRNLHYFERFEKRTIFEPIIAKYKKTKVYVWPAKRKTGLVAGGTVGGILRLAGYHDVKTKVIGSRHPHNTVKATFKALSMVQPPAMMAARQEELDSLM